MVQPGSARRAAIEGAIAGGIALRAMDPITDYLYKRENSRAREREERARGERAAYDIAAEKMTRLIGVELSPEREKQVGAWLHASLGVSGGILYALVRRRFTGSRPALAALYGLAFFLVVDEALNTLLKFTPPPQKFPWQAHFRGLTAHLALGLATEASLQALERGPIPRKLSA